MQPLKNSRGKIRFCCYTHFASCWVLHCAMKGQDQTSVVQKEIADSFLLAIQRSFQWLEVVCHLLTLLFRTACRAPNIRSRIYHHRQRLVQGCWATWGAAAGGKTSLILGDSRKMPPLTTFFSSKTTFLTTLTPAHHCKTSFLWVRTGWEHLSPAMRWRCQRAPSHADCTTGKAPPGSSASRKKIPTMDFPGVQYRNAALLSTGRRKNYRFPFFRCAFSYLEIYI